MKDTALTTHGRLPRRWSVALVTGLIFLAACSSSPPPREPPPPPCPTALILKGADRTLAFQSGAETDLKKMRYLAVLTDLESACRYDKDGVGVDVDLAFKLIAERGPAFEGPQVDLTYFIATLGPDQQVLDKQLFDSDVVFEDGQLAGTAEELTLRFPSIPIADGGAYTLFIGLQLDDAEIDRRMRPLLQQSQDQSP